MIFSVLLITQNTHTYLHMEIKKSKSLDETLWDSRPVQCWDVLIYKSKIISHDFENVNYEIYSEDIK